MGSTVEEVGDCITDIRYRDSDILCIYQQCADTEEHISSALSEVDAITHSKTMRTEMVESSTLGDFRLARVSDREVQACSYTMRFLFFVPTFNRKSILA